MQKIQLVSVNKLTAWEKNPRERDPERFDWIKLSLQKFGFVTPVYAREDGLIFSGHQRTSAAVQIGLMEVPVVFLPEFDGYTERVVNINFNLCTNDHKTKADFGAKAGHDLKDVVELVRGLRDAKNPYPVLDVFDIRPIEYTDILTDQKNINNAIKRAADFFSKAGIDIPVVLDKHGNIINGINRLASAYSFNRLTYPAVCVANNTELLREFLNKITMSFDLQKAFGDELRHNSYFYRINQAAQRSILGVGFYHWVFKKDAAKGKKAWLMQHMTLLEGEYRQRWIAEHGTTVIDFGAGRLDNTVKLQASGINCIPFEPYTMKPKTDDIDFRSARILTTQFLNWVAKKNQLHSVFCSSVFNSVPFAQDREYLMVIFQALCLHGAKLYLTTLNECGIIHRLFGSGVNKTSRVDDAILLDTEPGLMIGSLTSDNPKIQKYHSKEELTEQGRRYFHDVQWVSANGASHGIKCQGSKTMNWEFLVEALLFEFNLPYPQERRMGLGIQALEAFSKYCNYDLTALAHQMQQNQKSV